MSTPLESSTQNTTDGKNKGVVRIDLHPDADPLSRSELSSAVKSQVVPYRQIVRTAADDPVVNQALGLLSFLIFDAPQKTNAGKYVYGFVKLRGNYPDEYSAQRAATDIVKEQDSKYRIHMGPVGVWLPITDDENFVKKQIDVKTDDEEIQLRDQAARDEEAKRQRKIRELKEREEELRNDSNDPYADRDGIRYYVMKRVTEKELIMNVEVMRNKLKDAEQSIEKTRRDLYDLNKKHPEYNGKWLDVYNEERKRAGIPNYIPNQKLLTDYAEWKQSYESTLTQLTTN